MGEVFLSLSQLEGVDRRSAIGRTTVAHGCGCLVLQVVKLVVGALSVARISRFQQSCRSFTQVQERLDLIHITDQVDNGVRGTVLLQVFLQIARETA